MNKNPFLNAVFAGVYIALIVFVIQTVGETILGTMGPSVLVLMVMLSVFVLSAAIMGFLFVARPLELFIENQKQEALRFFAKTLGAFAVIVLIFLGVLLYMK